MASLLPTIDLKVWTSSTATEEDRDRIAAAWYSAFQCTGLVYLTNHGLAELYHEVAAEWEQFCAMGQEEKEKFSSAVYGACGYNSVGKEAVALSENSDDNSDYSSLADPVESLENGYSAAFDGAFPQNGNGYIRGDNLKNACVNLYKALDKDVVRPCLGIASKALEMQETDLESAWFTEGPGAYQLRLARYAPRNTVEDKAEVLYGEHTDYDGLTFLWRNQTNGLQALIDGTWTSIPVMTNMPDALVINLGDLMQFWTREVWHSPLHRVIKTTPNQDISSSGLVSIVFFAGPHADTKLLPLPSPLIPHVSKEDAILTAGQHVQEKIARTAQ